jgi:hypothetical protein
LGDFARNRTVLNIGDGSINFNDAAAFFQHYGTSSGDGIYRSKFDISSDISQDYNTLPVPDGDIDFWDLIVFATGYAKTGSGQQFKGNENKNQIMIKNSKINYSFGNFTKTGENIEIPIKISGDVRDLYGLSIEATFNSNNLDFIKISKGEMYNSQNSFTASRIQGSNVFFDAVMLGNSNVSGSNEQIAGYFIFKEKKTLPDLKTEIGLISCEAVDYHNNPIQTEMSIYKK